MDTDLVLDARAADPAACPAWLDEPLLARMDRPGPRYTSYPTADRFTPAFGSAQLLQALAQRRDGPQAEAPLSLYVHVPFCASVCYYCACNKVVTKDRGKVGPYLAALREEVRRVHGQLGPARVAQLHVGGGTPTYLDDDDLARLVDDLRARFPWTADTECSIEIDPRTVTPERLATLKTLGFNRVSFGVQDIDPQVQAAVHRVQPLEDITAVMAAARALRFASINVDLIYGLPRQTPSSFSRTVAEVARLRPDRIAVYGYAHLPERFKPQRRIVEAELPSGAARLAMLGTAIGGFLAAGYDAIGMDHFALPRDALARAKRAGRLRRNFQGYSTQPGDDLVAFGVSAISRVGRAYSQNPKTLDAYCAALTQSPLPAERGLLLDDDDLLRRDAIMAVMCDGELDYAALGRAHGLSFEAYFASECRALEDLAAQGLLRLRPGGFAVTQKGWYFVRAIAMVFDRGLQGITVPKRYSKVV